MWQSEHCMSVGRRGMGEERVTGNVVTRREAVAGWKRRKSVGDRNI